MNVYKMKMDMPNKAIKPGKLEMRARTSPQGESFGFTNFYMTRNDQPVIPIVGEFHYSRFSCLHWEEELLKMRAGGVNLIATYVFWNHHEEEEGVFDWSGDRNMRHFVDLCAKHSLPLILRIGPFCHGEVRNGGIPDWMFGKPLELRSNDDHYLFYAERFYREISRQVKGTYFQDGGPIIAVQLENEYMHAGAPMDVFGYKPGVFFTSGSDGKAHLAELRRIAEEAGIRPLFFTATAWGGAAVLEPAMLPMLAGYAYTPWIPDQPPSGEFVYRDLHAVPAEPVQYETSDYPVAYCEMAGGMQVSYRARPFVAPESVEAMTMVKLASGSNLLGYYMYHGGSNPQGKHVYLNESGLPKITYDYQAPLGEFGRVGASYDRIRTIGLMLDSFGSLLAPMGTVLPEGQDRLDPADVGPLRWCIRQKDGAGFLFMNNFQDHVDMPDRPNIRFELDTPRGKAAIPRKGSMTLKKDAAVALPFYLTVDGLTYVSCTVQPLTRLRKADRAVHVFYAHDGIPPEIVLDRRLAASVKAPGATVQLDEELWVVHPVVGRSHSIDVRLAEGGDVRILILTREEALRTYRLPLWGEDQLIIGEAHMYAKAGQLICTSEGRSRFTISVLSDEAEDWASHGGRLSVRQEGAFHTLSLECDDYEPEIRVQHRLSRFASVEMAASWPEHVDDVFLKIDYDGDVAGAYIGNRLITDHIPYGDLWRIGLKQFRHLLNGEPLLLSITPLRRGEVHAFVNQAYVERFEGEEIARFNRIEAVPYYVLAITKTMKR